jgi:hypothetical protein
MGLHTSMWEAAVNTKHVLNQSELCEPGNCSALTGFMTATALGFTDLVLPSLKPDWIVWNCGLWKGCNVQPEELMAAAVKALNDQDPRNVLWKTTTMQSDGNGFAGSSPHVELTESFRNKSSRIMPAHQLTADLREAHLKRQQPLDAAAQGNATNELYMDVAHFGPDGYREMNTLLLNMLALP